MSDNLRWYKTAIKAKNDGQPLPAVSETYPQWGFFWRKAGRSGGRIPVRIQQAKNGDIVAVSGTQSGHRMEDASNVWTWVAQNPVDRDSYIYAWEHEKWPDGTPTTAVASAATIGDNAHADPFEALQADLDDAKEKATAFLKDAAAEITETRASMATNLQRGILDIIKRSDAMHKAEKQPHLDASRDVDDKYRFRDDLKGIAARLRTVFENWMRAEEARKREDARKAFEADRAAAEAERRRIESERAKKMAEDPIAAMTDPEPELPIIPTAPKEVKVKVGGGVGRAAGLKTVYEPEIVDYAAALAHFAQHADVIAAVEKLVKAKVRLEKAQANIPGVKVHEERRAA